MIVKTDATALRQTSWHEYVFRFVVGGLITAAADVVAKSCDPAIGGLFLAFPAILPASLTLVAKHEREKKAGKGLNGERSGIKAAAAHAMGAALGSIGLACFACLNWRLLPSHRTATVFGVATGAWFAAAGLTWLIWKRAMRSCFESSVVSLRVFASVPEATMTRSISPARQSGAQPQSTAASRSTRTHPSRYRSRAAGAQDRWPRS